MTVIKNITIIGLGAIGSVYGNLLQRVSDLNVRVLVDSDRKSRYESEGIFVNGERLPFAYITPNEKTEEADLIIVSVKYSHLPRAIEDIRNQVGKNTVIMSLLNGITSEEEIAEVYGEDKVVYAISNGIDATREGTSIFCSNPGKISFGKKQNETISEKLIAIRECFERAQIPNDIPANMEQVLWYKFMINVGINQTSAVTGATYGVFQKIPYARELAKAAMMEVVQLAQLQNIALKERDIDVFFETIISSLSEEGKPSMLQDIEARRFTEVAMFSEKMMELGHRFNIETPVNQMLYQIIKTLESRFNY
ncbi:ketopantoate reductase family protein [Psychrobacillus sp. FJAT-21963]|uniref:ketopantoate reductase family protein n=1 Tax=Psychrobacillus sp. FJAT-21963 TaxID=1712028 RepID=UPI0007001315|nr:ketopantoate reductase family protein [Psychrobacillus sp. FJAT-21963]KQL34651.1 hypothetical protein AN959_13045 [Psychrobacillus sp. FJAT-21963]